MAGMAGGGYRHLAVWSHAVDLTAEIYRLSRSLPSGERYGLASQMQRAAVSIAANIAEGYGRRGRVEFGRFLLIANGSLKELETHLIVAERVGELPAGQVNGALAQAEEIGKMLAGLIRSLEGRRP